MTEYLIYVKHRKEWESIRRSWAADVLYWVSGCSIRGWDPYNRHDFCLKEGGIKPEDPIWLHVDEDRTITFTRKPPCWQRRIRSDGKTIAWRGGNRMTYRVSITIPNKCNQLPWHNVTSVHVTMDQMGMLLVFRGKKDDGSRYDEQILLGPDDSILIEGEDWE